MTLQCDVSAPQNLCGVRTYFNPQSQLTSGCDRLLLVGQKLAAGTAPAQMPVQVFSDENALFGEGSMLANMVKAARAQSQFGEIWAYPLADFGTKASAAITFVETLTAAATVYLVINGRVYSVAAAATDTATDIAAAFATIINDPALTATAAAGVLTVTTANGGLVGGYLDVRDGYARQRVFAHPEVAITVAMTAPAGVPALDLGGLGAEAFTFIAMPYHDTVTMTAFREYLCSTWGPMDRRRSQGFTAIDAPKTVTQALATAMNYGPIMLHPREGYLRPEYLSTAAVAALAASSLSTCRIPLAISEPLNGKTIIGEYAADIGDTLNIFDLDTLIGYGLSPFQVAADGSVTLAAFVTTSTVDENGVNDFSQRPGNIIPQLRYIGKFMEDRIWGTYAGYSLRDDGFSPRPGQRVVTTRMLRAFVRSLGYPLSNANVIQDPEAFADAVIVEKSGACVNISVDPQTVSALCCVNLFINARVS